MARRPPCDSITYGADDRGRVLDEPWSSPKTSATNGRRAFLRASQGNGDAERFERIAPDGQQRLGRTRGVRLF